MGGGAGGWELFRSAAWAAHTADAIDVGLNVGVLSNGCVRPSDTVRLTLAARVTLAHGPWSCVNTDTIAGSESSRAL